MDAPPVGSILGERYVLGGRLVEAPGHVELRALDREVEVEVALWWLRPPLFGTPGRQDAVLGAGVELRQLHDPALRKCFGVGRGTGGLWAIWQLASGPGPVPLVGEAVPAGELRRWLAAVGQGLGVLHAQGFVHGRLSPADVVSIGGVLKLGGGGLWRDADPRALAAAWAAFQHHLAPEVRRGEPASEASDVWSMAAIALEMIAGMSSAEPDTPRMAARRHPDLAAVLVGAMNPDPSRRPSIAELALATLNAGEAPYRDGAARGKPAQHGGDAATLVGHATGHAPTAPRPGARPTASRPVPAAAATRPGAFAPLPESFALPTPSVAPRAPRPTPPVVMPVRPAPVVSASQPAQPQPVIPPPAMPTPARVAIAGAIDRARTAPPGEFVVAAVSLKPPLVQAPAPPVLPAAPTGGTPVLAKAKIRGIAEAQGGRTFSVAPGQLGYLAPPKAVSDAANQRQRRWWLLVILLMLVAVAGGVALGLML